MTFAADLALRANTGHWWIEIAGWSQAYGTFTATSTFFNSRAVADRFARSPFLAVAEVEDGEIREIRFIKNPGREALGGAAVKTLQALAELDVKIIVGPAFGPNAVAMAEELGMRRITVAPGTPLREALEKAISGKA